MRACAHTRSQCMLATRLEKAKAKERIFKCLYSNILHIQKQQYLTQIIKFKDLRTFITSKFFMYKRPKKKTDMLTRVTRMKRGQTMFLNEKIQHKDPILPI